MVAGYFQPAERREGKNSPYQTKRLLSANNARFLLIGPGVQLFSLHGFQLSQRRKA
jgi:hypothetical protein